jgi:SH3-like domain-containing protein
MIRVSGRLLPLLLALVLVAGGAGAQSRNARDADSVPRFVSLKSDNVHLRVGPGTQHPIEWVLQRRNLPVRVIAEIDQWRRIVDSTGTVGWVHQQMLSGRRYGIVTGEVRPLRREPNREAVPVARLEPGVIGRLLECRDAWCRMEAGGFRGWIARNEFWGTDPNEVVK